MPPSNLLKDGTNLNDYVKCPERYISERYSEGERWKALEWLLSEGGKEFTSLDFSGMDWVFTVAT